MIVRTVSLLSIPYHSLILFHKGKDVQLDLKDGTILTGVLHTTTFPLRKQSPDSEFPMFTQDFPKQILLKACKVKQVLSLISLFVSFLMMIYI